jgi:cytochrome c oxidase subunit 3
LASNPSSSFFYVLTGAHVLHVLGALGWFPRAITGVSTGRPDALRLYGIYWHYLGALWLYLVVLMFGL